MRAGRLKRILTQEQLAEDIKIEPHTLRAYENGERQLNNINELRRIADTLGVEPEELGLAGNLYVPKTPEEIENVINMLGSWLMNHAWSKQEQSLKN